MEYLIFSVLLIVVATIGVFFGQKLKQAKVESLQIQLQKEENERQLLVERLKESDILKNQFQQDLIRKESQHHHLQEKLDEQKTDLLQLEKRFKTEFENLAQKILDQKSEKFTAVNQKNIHQILLPLQEKIKVFEEQVSKNNETFIKENSKLEQQLKY